MQPDERAGGFDRRYKALACVLMAGFIVRVWATHWPPFPIDMNDWIAWGEHVRSVGPGGFYTDKIFADYAPGYVYVMWLTAAVKHAFFETSSVETYYFLYRLPSMLFDLGTTALIFFVVEKALRQSVETTKATPAAATARKAKKKKRAAAQQANARFVDPTIAASLAAACYVFNPAVIFNSAVWGQVDASFTFLMVLTLVLLLRGRIEWATACYAVAFLVKPQSISLAPLLGIAAVMRFPFVRLIKSALVGIALAFVLIYPFFGVGSFARLIALLNKSVETYPYTSMFMYNLWGIFGFWQSDVTGRVAGLTLRSIGTLLYVAGILAGVALLFRQLRRTKDDAYTLFYFAAYFTFLPVMVLTRMHERYLYPVLPFLLAYAFLSAAENLRARRQSRIAGYVLTAPFALYIALTVLHTMNLYQVYTYYLNYKTGVDRSNVLYYFIDGYGKFWSVLVLLIFAAIALLASRWSLPASMRREAGS
ncbi:MAG: glycosyltransferase 87 family protein [Pyrinomonadaceae bacterium]